MQLGASPHVTPTLIWPHACTHAPCGAPYLCGQHTKELPAEACMCFLTFLKTSASGIGSLSRARSPLPRPTSSSQTSGVDVDGAAPLKSLRFSVPMQTQSKLQGGKHVWSLSERSSNPPQLLVLVFCFLVFWFFPPTSPPSRRPHLR